MVNGFDKGNVLCFKLVLILGSLFFVAGMDSALKHIRIHYWSHLVASTTKTKGKGGCIRPRPLGSILTMLSLIKGVSGGLEK
jgi:hypothetical protein